jgi:anti-anti-sigma factor
MRLTVSGELDFRECERFIRETTAQLAPGVPATVLTLDLGRVTYCDSAGLSALMQVRRACEAAGWTFVLGAVAPSVGRVLDMTGLSAWFGPANL